jgi:hypothetical protein
MWTDTVQRLSSIDRWLWIMSDGTMYIAAYHTYVNMADKHVYVLWKVVKQ